MSPEESIKEKLIKNNPEWGKRYNENEYLSNKPAIKRLIVEKKFELEYSLALEKERERLQQQIHELELRNRELEVSLRETGEKEKIILILSLLIAILIGIGINIVTDKPYGWTGWVMIGVACILQITVFIIRPKVSTK